MTLGQFFPVFSSFDSNETKAIRRGRSPENQGLYFAGNGLSPIIFLDA
jgi:hypothetical protein